MATGQSTIPGIYGGFWLRVGARVIDIVITAVIMGVIELLWRGALDGYDAAGEESLWLLIWLIGHWLYYAGLHASEWQATLGKRVFGLRVVDLEGERIGFGRATGRYFAEFLSALILLIGYLMVAFTERKQGLHDMLANTLVVRAGARAMTGNRTPYAEAEDGSSARSASLSTPVEARHHGSDVPKAAEQPIGRHDSRLPRGGRSWVFAGFSDSGDVQRWVVQESDFSETSGEVVFGRNSESCHLVIPDMTVSGVHGRFRINAADLEVADLDSTNGTAINGVALSPRAWRRLGDGDLLSIGGAELRVFLSEG